ncbi:astacin-like metalloendopeptidase [Pelodytes ibericus]
MGLFTMHFLILLSTLGSLGFTFPTQGDIAMRLGRIASTCSMNICLWPKSADGMVYIPYTASSDYKFMELAILRTAFSKISDATCIRFVPRSTEIDYISFENLNGCWSTVGKAGGLQVISLQKPGCTLTGIVTHEILHALGLHHEHVRRDRDQYISVLWDNIIPEMSSNFITADTYNMKLTRYDYFSIMHYGRTSFSVDGFLPTLVPIPDNNNIDFGLEDSMSDLDIRKIYALYNCDQQTAAINSVQNIMSVMTADIRQPTSAFSTTTTPKTTPPKTTRTTTATPATTTTSTTTRTTTTTPKTTTTPTTTRTTTTTPKTTRTTTATTATPTTTRTTTQTTRTTTATTTSKPTNGCGGKFVSPSGVITSPNYPSKYSSSAFCLWNITLNSQFRVTFTDMDLEESPNCIWDSVKVYNGPMIDQNYLQGKYCGNKLPLSIWSNWKSIQIIFTTDESVERQGFRIVYQAGKDQMWDEYF